MKKLVLACVLSFTALIAFAQDSPGVLSFSAKEMYGTDEQITVTAQYTEANPGTSRIVSYVWEIRPVSADGIVGDPIFSQNYDGDPSGDFTFPESVTASLTPENDYQINLTAFDNADLVLTAYPIKFAWTSYVLTAPKEICCGEGITVTGSFTGPAQIGFGMTYQWSATMCDAQGNSTWPLSYYVSGMIQGFPYGPLTVPNSGLPYPTGVKCDQYYRIDVTFYPNQYTRPITRSVIVYMTSFMLSANTNFCSGQFIYASGKYCHDTNSPPVNDHQWSLYNSDAAGNILSNNLLPALLIGGAPTPNEIVYYTNNLAPGYYLLKLDFMYNSSISGTRTQVVYVNPSPQPAITGSSACGSGGFQATPTGSNYTYVWSAYNNNTLFTSPTSQYGNSFSVGPGLFNKVKVVVTDQTGCSAQTTKTVPYTLPNISSDFTITGVSYGTNDPYFYMQVNRVGNYSLSGVSDYFVVSNTSTGVPISCNYCWTNTPAWGSNILFKGYIAGYSTGVITNCAPTSFDPQHNLGRFDKNSNYPNYYIEHYMTYNGCSFYTAHQYNWSYGTFRMVGTGNTDDPTSNSFDVFPNPNNGSFTVQFSDAAENAQAELYNMIGERVDAFKLSGTSYDYTPSAELKPGLYMLRITNNGVTTTKKIVVQ